MRPIDYFDRGAQSACDQVFVEGNGHSYTYAQAKEETESLACSLYSAGFELGDSVAVFSPNEPAAVVCILAIYRAGGAWVPVNVRNAPGSNAEYMAYVNTRWLFFHSSEIDAAEAIIPLLPDLKAAVCIDSGDTPYPALSEFCQPCDDAKRIADHGLIYQRIVRQGRHGLASQRKKGRQAAVAPLAVVSAIKRVHRGENKPKLISSEEVK